MLFSGPKQMELEETVGRLMEQVERYEKRFGQDLTRVEASSELRRLKFTLIKMWKDGERDLVKTQIIDYCIMTVLQTMLLFVFWRLFVCNSYLLAIPVSIAYFGYGVYSTLQTSKQKYAELEETENAFEWISNFDTDDVVTDVFDTNNNDNNESSILNLKESREELLEFYMDDVAPLNYQHNTVANSNDFWLTEF
ncbi:hypothetical protein GCK72_016702 [Caenorhabditis remanei]|uniref:Calcium uniporter protein n=1 Tax=Caenorhabditis remanei TaxID=31234 RepID=A0A6A5G656_CAERE|nr:hypothetical protein GCK72_016702 [Caenorhabditis remanei]KAF1750155.1 hypothetical protein GCK72_016702 [Caenorhabditis remanei]